MSTDRAQKIAALNDAMRRQIGKPATGGDAVPGQAMMTRGIASLPLATQILIWARVRNFSDFSEDNDPYGEHDFGAFSPPGVGKVFWKIDYYADEACRYGSDDPADPARSYRILTIMLAEEY